MRAGGAWSDIRPPPHTIMQKLGQSHPGGTPVDGPVRPRPCTDALGGCGSTAGRAAVNLNLARRPAQPDGLGGPLRRGPGRGRRAERRRQEGGRGAPHAGQHPDLSQATRATQEARSVPFMAARIPAKPHMQAGTAAVALSIAGTP